MNTTPLDPRRHAFRDDLAAEELRGKVTAPRYVAGEVRQVVHSATPLRGRPDARQSWTSEVLYGEHVIVYDERDGWAWVQLARDGYVGYLRSGSLSPQVKAPTHRVRALGSFVPTRHIAELGRNAPDFVAVAERFLGVPYLWGGKTRLGLDCSGLVQVAMSAAGLDCPRDSDMQQAELGGNVRVHADLDGLELGDLVFWKGHMGIMTDAFLLLHANAHHMAVAIEPLRAAVDRIARSGLAVTAIKRLEAKSA